MDWDAVDERLIRRGELLLSLDFLEDYDLSLLNERLGAHSRLRVGMSRSSPLSAADN